MKISSLPLSGCGASVGARIELTSDSSLRDMLAAIELGSKSFDFYSANRFLIDLRSVKFGAVEGDIASHHAGSLLKNNSRHIRIAVLVKERQGNGQRIARQQGADLRVFAADEEDFATEWLGEP